MSVWNYVVTAHKPTSVSHSCVGNFTSPNQLNLIIAKCTRIEIHLLTPQGLQPMLDVPIYGRIATIELFRPHWDADKSELLTRAMGDVSDRIGRPTDNGQIGIIDPDCRLIGLHLYDGLFKVIPFDNKGQLKEAFNIRLEELQVLDIKFLHGCVKPTIVVLYQDNKDARHVKTYEVALKEKDFVEGPWSQNNLDNGAGLLIPVPAPLGGVIIIGEETIVYCNANATFKAIPIKQSIIRAYGRVDPDGSRYLLGDNTGTLHLLVLTHERERVTGLKVEYLGETSIASSISYLDNGVVYVGSRFGDSQLVKLNLQADASGSFVEVLERYVNLGPIVDFCVVDLDRQGQGQVVTCSGACKDGSIRASVELQGIKGLWSLKSSFNDPYDMYLVVSFISETRFLAMNMEDELEETEIEGFDAQTQTLFCQNAINDLLIQVTANSVRLVSCTSRELVDQWNAPAGFSVNVASANASQVLLATGGGHLVYLEIRDAKLVEVKHAQLEHEISCLDLNPVGDNPQYSSLAAVGMWTDISVRIFSLPDLELVRKETLGGEIVPRLAIAKEGELSIGTIDDIQKLHIRTIPLNEQARRICHQAQSRTLAFCSFKYNQTTYVLPEENEPTKGRILVFAVEDGRLQLIVEKETKGAVYSLNAFNGKLLAAINQKIQLYKWMLREDGSHELQSECGHHGHILALYTQTRGDFIVVGDLMKSISLLVYKHEESAIEERARDYNANWMTAVEMLDDEIYIGAENNYNLFTVRKNSDAPATDDERARLEVVGEYHLGEFVNRFRHGSLVMRLPDSEMGQIPTVIFGTINGVIGIIASLPHDQYVFLEKLQSTLVKFIKGVGNLSHEAMAVIP
ncbi:hypothetical protein PR202_gb02295 [Eleusine coracana subsp. coracana]|uniref:DNA damage-binding protein 1 n=1 Tax=Eleusine coracana subsp. coracana TaxID=191504 RepID=A0AAV5DZS0_ELECO|nr:hypothetical protein PR202_gb02295 [Eleusine coracana subsp. coracana]